MRDLGTTVVPCYLIDKNKFLAHISTTDANDHVSASDRSAPLPHDPALPHWITVTLIHFIQYIEVPNKLPRRVI